MGLPTVWLLTGAVLVVGTAIAREMLQWFRNVIPTTVQCWFCSHTTEIPHNLSNKWHCPRCEQYNGFAKDGGYNAPIQQQYEEKLNFPVSALGQRKSAWRRDSSLCADCNRNQQLKVEQLASFIPINERNFDSEIEHFTAQIDKAYKLCTDCEALLYSILRKEREEYCVPRRLNTALVSKDPKGTTCLIVNILLSLLLIIIGLLQTRGARKAKKLLWPRLLSISKAYSSEIHVYLSTASLVAVRAAVVSLVDYILPAGIAFSLLAYYLSNRRPLSLMLNSLAWLALLVVMVCFESVEELAPFFQVSAGIFSAISSGLVLKKIYDDVIHNQRKLQTSLQPKVPKSFQSYTPNGTSTPRGSPGQSYNCVESSFRSTKSCSQETTWPRRRDIGLEPAIRGLNIGTKPRSNRKEDDVQSLWSVGPGSNSTTFLPNSTAWTAYSSPMILQPTGTSPNFMHHLYSGDATYLNSSRPTSPALTVTSQLPANLNHSFSDLNLRNRNLSSTIVSPARLTVDSVSSSGVSTLESEGPDRPLNERLRSRLVSRRHLTALSSTT